MINSADDLGFDLGPESNQSRAGGLAFDVGPDTGWQWLVYGYLATTTLESATYVGNSEIDLERVDPAFDKSS